MMRKIQMVDLRAQYEAIRGEVNAEMQFVLDTATYVKGGKVVQFQQHLQNYLGVKHVIPVANGTDALQIALMSLGLVPGDEVITPTFTFAATVEVVALLGLTPVMVDVDYDTFTLSMDGLRQAITPKTKAIIPVHLYGQNAYMDGVLQIAKEYGLYVVEDACQSIGTNYYFADGTVGRSGCMGHIGCTSFFPSKNLGCYGDGGALFTNDDDLAARITAIANHGMSVRYHHDVIGVNSRLDSLQAAVLDVKLKYLDTYLERRQLAAAYYDAALVGNPHIVLPARTTYSEHTFHQYTIKLVGVDRNRVQQKLAERDVPAMIYYPIPLHMQKAYHSPRYKRGDFPVAESLAQSVLSLPMHTELDEEQLNYITSQLLEVLHS